MDEALVIIGAKPSSAECAKVVAPNNDGMICRVNWQINWLIDKPKSICNLQ